jgi:hypothetical protein
VLERGLLERVRGARRVEQVARDHRVGVHAGERDPVPRQHDHVGLDVVPDLEDLRILEERPERGQGGLDPELLRAVERAVSQRNVVRLPRRGGARDAHDARAHRDGNVGQHAEGEPPRRPERRHERVERLARADEGVLLRDGVGRRRVLHHERPEAEPREELVAALAGAARVAQRRQIHLDRDVGADPQQLAALARRVRVRGERFAVALLRHAGRSRQQRVERAVGADQLARALLADAGHALHVVDRVAHQREHVHDLIRADAELLPHPAFVVPRAVVARVVHRDAASDELEEVLVARHDRDLEPGGDGARRDRADHVVRLVALVGQNRHAERAAGVVDPRDLIGQLGRHRRARRLVVARQLGSEGRARQIERRGDELGMVLGDELAQHRDEDVDGVGRLARRAREPGPAHRVVRPVHLRAAVDEIEPGLHGASVRSDCRRRAAAAARRASAGAGGTQ